MCYNIIIIINSTVNLSHGMLNFYLPILVLNSSNVNVNRGSFTNLYHFHADTSRSVDKAVYLC